MNLTRRNLMKLTAATAATGALGMPARAQTIDELVIAYNVPLPSWDPTTGPSAVNPTIQGIYQSVFDQFILQQPDLKPAPGLLTEWGWNDDRTKVMMTVREGVTWHDGSPFTAEDVAWSLARAADPATGNPINFIWSTLENFKADGNTVTADVKQFDPTIFKWMYFLTGYVLPKAYYEKVGAEGFEAAPIGTGPYMVDKFERNAFVRLKANQNYWGGKSDFETVTIKFVTDAAARVAEVESGNAQVTLEMPYEEYDRLKGSLNGVAHPISDIGMIFLNDIDVMLDPNVRKAAAFAIDKQTIIDRLLSGYGVAIDTLQTPEYEAYDPSIKVPYDPEKAKQMLADAGYPDGFETEIFYDISRGTIREPMAILIKESLAELGIDVTIQKVPGANWFAKMLEKSMPMVIASFYAWLDWPEYHFYWTYHGGNNSVFNAASYVNPELDALIDQARAETDPAVYDDLISQMNVIAMEDVPKIPLARNYLDTAIQSNVEGYKYWFHTQLDFRALSKS